MEQRRDQQKPGQRAGRQQGAQNNAPRQPQQSQGGSGQQGGQSGARQEQQFQSGSGQQGGSGGEGSLADQIREHMQVVDQAGAQIGTVDHVEGDRIKLTRASSGTGEHRYLPLSQVAGIESNTIRLRDRGDTSFGMEADR